MKKILFLIFILVLGCAASWKITEQTATRIVMELVEDPVDPTPIPPVEDPVEVPADGNAWLMGYYVGYQRGLYPPEKVDFTSITHLMVGRVVPKADGTLTTDLDIDDTNGPALAKSLAGLAHKNLRKAILMIGGDGAHSGWVGSASSANRSKFVDNLLSVMDAWGYDGLDLDWEPILDYDKPDLLALIKELRAKRPNMILTIPVGWVNANLKNADPWLKNIEPYVDRINVMSYLMGGPWSGWLSWHSSALSGHGAQYPSSIEVSAEGYRSVGIPAGKIGIGVGFFGVCWKGVTGPKQSTSGASIVASDNTMSYRNILASYLVESAYKWDSTAYVPYLSYPNGYGPLGCNFISAEDESSVSRKGEYVRVNGLGGAIVWTVNQGYLPDKDDNPLLVSLANGMFVDSQPLPIPVPTPDVGQDISGNISGIFEVSKSPYNVVGDVHVPKGKTLIIEPGVKLIFKGHYKMTVEGILVSKGTSQLPIIFTADDTAEGWNGLRWQTGTGHDTTGLNIIKHTVFEYGNKTKVVINGSYKENRAGALFVYGVENIQIEDNVFRYNRSNDKCGAVMMLAIDAPISFKNNSFEGNESYQHGGALCFTHGKYQDLYGGSFQNNKSAKNYGAIYVYDTKVTLHNVGFSGNIPNNYNTNAVSIAD